MTKKDLATIKKLVKELKVGKYGACCEMLSKDFISKRIDAEWLECAIISFLELRVIELE
jgi:hypothetical protein